MGAIPAADRHQMKAFQSVIMAALETTLDTFKIPHCPCSPDTSGSAFQSTPCSQASDKQPFFIDQS